MPSFVVDPRAVRSFESATAFEAWLAKHHQRAAEVWIKIFKKASGKPTIDPSQAIDVCLCWGWIDGISKPFDHEAYLQRYTPRKPRSRWSQINVERVARLVKAGRMTPYGQLHVDAAKADGRWDAAYPPPSLIQVPKDFLDAVAKEPKALAIFRGLNRANSYAIAYRLHHLITAAKRSAFIASWVEKLSRGEVPHPPKPPLAAKAEKRATPRANAKPATPSKAAPKKAAPKKAAPKKAAPKKTKTKQAAPKKAAHRATAKPSNARSAIAKRANAKS